MPTEQVLMQSSTSSPVPTTTLRPGDPAFDETTVGFNLAAPCSPDEVALVAGPQDVAAGFERAREKGWSVRVQATGHGAVRPARGGLLLDTRRMNAVRIDPAACTASVGAGARWSEVVAAAADHGLAPLNGSSLTVGVIGYLMGGGMGPMARTFGFAADHVRRLELVTPDGTLRQVDAVGEPELFWGLRGGKCELGVVTAAEIDLMPVADVYGGGLFFDGEDAPRVLHAWREWATDLPDEVTTSVALLRLPDAPFVPEPLRGRLTVHLRYVYVGPDDRGSELLAPMRAAAPLLIDAVARMPYADIGSVHNDPQDPLPVWDRSTLLGELPEASVDALLAAAGPGVESPLIIAELRLLGGALSRTPATANAVGGREAAYSCYVVGPLPPPLADITPAAGCAVVDALAPWSTGTTQVNFQGSRADATDVRRAWAPEHRERLDRLHQLHDPEGLCRFALPTRPDDPDDPGDPVVLD